MEKLVIFDLDGTLLDTIEDIKNALNKALINLGYNVNYSKKEVSSFVGSGALILAKRALEKLNIEDEKIILELRDEYNSIYGKSSNIYTKPFDGIKEMLEVLKHKNFKLVVFSNKPDIDTKSVIKSYFGDNLFDVVRGQIEGVKVKPNPEGLYNILKIFPTINKENIYYVGDSDVDMETGKNASLKTIGVTWGYRDKSILESYNPTIIVDSVESLFKTLTKI